MWYRTWITQTSGTNSTPSLGVSHDMRSQGDLTRRTPHAPKKTWISTDKSYNMIKYCIYIIIYIYIQTIYILQLLHSNSQFATKNGQRTNGCMKKKHRDFPVPEGLGMSCFLQRLDRSPSLPWRGPDSQPLTEFARASLAVESPRTDTQKISKNHIPAQAEHRFWGKDVLKIS